MSVELTEPQQRAMDAEGRTVRFTDPRTNDEYVLVPVREFEAIQGVLEDERRQRAIRRIGRRNAAGRMRDEP